MTLSGLLLAVANSTVASILVKATVTTTLGLAGARLARRSRASVRHVLLASAFAGLLALPIAAIVAPSISVTVPIAPAPIAVPTVEERVIETSTSVTPVNPPAERPVESAASVALSASTLLLAAWTAGIALCLSPIVAGLWQMRSLRRSALPWRQGASAIEALAREAGIVRRVELLRHDGAAGPMTCGVVRPAIVLPMDAESWSAEDLTRAIVHELEHVRRGDWISQCAARTICAVYWFHPLVWIAWRQLALEAERACDDAVLQHPSTGLGAGADATAYADQLIGLAARLSSSPPRPLLAMANRHDLATRVGAVLDGHQSRGRAGALVMVMVGAIAALVVTAVSPIQMVAEIQGGQKFDVVSVKPCNPEGPQEGGRGASPPASSPGRMTLNCQSVQGLIRTAYLLYADPSTPRPDAVLATPLDGGPAWMESARYTIEATAADAAGTATMQGPMLRSVLEDRFKLRLHRETREIPVYALRESKGGAKLRPFHEGSCVPRPSAPGPVPKLAADQHYCGLRVTGDGVNTVMDVEGVTLDEFAKRFVAGGGLDRPIIDQTGLAGRFDFHLEFAREDPKQTAGSQGLSASTGASIFTAMQEQLGLKLEAAKGPGEFLVIDHLERPSPNAPAGDAAQIVPVSRPANTPRYEAVSIKPCKGFEPVSQARTNVPPNGGFSPGRMHVECSPLVGANGLIRKAYGTFASGVYNAFLHQSALPIEGGPAWITSEYYTIDAKADGTPSIEMMHGPMMQVVLEDRFQLRIRRELRDMPVYELAVAKGGAKLKPFDGSCKPVDMSKGSIISQLEAEGACPVAMGNHRIDAPGQTISDFITFALTFMDRPVIDKTGLNGRFDIHLTLPQDDPAGAQDNTSTLAAVMQQQLGLKVVTAKAPGAVLVIEHVERPSPDFAAFAATSGRPDGPVSGPGRAGG